MSLLTTPLVVQLHPAEEQAVDFGHIDLWTVDNAPSLVWTPILNRINAHTTQGPGGRDITMK